jgi:hypothetical protein
VGKIFSKATKLLMEMYPTQAKTRLEWATLEVEGPAVFSVGRESARLTEVLTQTLSPSHLRCFYGPAKAVP